MRQKAPTALPRASCRPVDIPGPPGVSLLSTRFALGKTPCCPSLPRRPEPRGRPADGGLGARRPISGGGGNLDTHRRSRPDFESVSAELSSQCSILPTLAARGDSA